MSQYGSQQAENVQSRGNEPEPKPFVLVLLFPHSAPASPFPRSKIQLEPQLQIPKPRPPCLAAISFSCRIYISQQFRQRRFHVTDALHFSSCEALYLIGKLLASLTFPLFCCHLVCLRTLHRPGANFFPFWADCRCAHSQALLRCPCQRKPSLPCYFN